MWVHKVATQMLPCPIANRRFQKLHATCGDGYMYMYLGPLPFTPQFTRGWKCLRLLEGAILCWMCWLIACTRSKKMAVHLDMHRVEQRSHITLSTFCMQYLLNHIYGHNVMFLIILHEPYVSSLCTFLLLNCQ